MREGNREKTEESRRKREIAKEINDDWVYFVLPVFILAQTCRFSFQVYELPPTPLRVLIGFRKLRMRFPEATTGIVKISCACMRGVMPQRLRQLSAFKASGNIPGPFRTHIFITNQIDVEDGRHLLLDGFGLPDLPKPPPGNR